MKNLLKKIKILFYAAYAGFAVMALQAPAHASPFGQGLFNAAVPFGSLTSLSVALGGNVSLNLTSNGSNYTATGSHNVTITTNDVVGYSLYAYALGNSNMVSPSNTIPASGNASAAPLTTNSWGYNTDGSGNYLGLTTTPTNIKTSYGSSLSTYKTGETTTVYYSVLAPFIKDAGSYQVNIVYVAASLSQ